MRIRFSELYHRIFHDNDEEYELRLKIYGNKADLEAIQQIVTTAVNGNAK